MQAGTVSDREAQILALFQQCLGVDEVSLDDDFFVLGGDSFAAMRFVARVYDLCGVEFQQDVLFQYSTPRTFAQMLDGEASPGTNWPASLVPLNDARRGAPVFFIPGESGDVEVFRPLVARLTSTRPAYGLRAPDLDWPGDVLAFDELVLHYVIEIRRQQPRGPYMLAGFAFGGVLAFEVANRLTADGQVVRRLILIETAAPPPSWRRLLSVAQSWFAARGSRPRALRALGAKHEWLVGRHRLGAVFSRTITIFAGADTRAVAGWQRYTSEPLDVRSVRLGAGATASSGSLLDPPQVPTFAREFERLLDSHG